MIIKILLVILNLFKCLFNFLVCFSKLFEKNENNINGVVKFKI